MNKTHWEHAGYALIMQGIVWLFTDSILAGACFGYAFFLGREHAQFEYKLTNGGPVGNLTGWEGFQIWKWDRDSQLDLLFPAIAVCLVVYFVKES